MELHTQQILPSTIKQNPQRQVIQEVSHAIFFFTNTRKSCYSTSKLKSCDILLTNTTKPCYSAGRLESCDIVLTNTTNSGYSAG